MSIFSRMRNAKTLCAVFLAAWLLGGCQPLPSGRNIAAPPAEPVTRAFMALLEDANPSTRLDACFLSVGLPEKPELAYILRSRLAGATPPPAGALERVVALYALAAMTRAPEDIDAFLDAFPGEPQLFFDLMEAEWELSGTFNAGMADFLLLLAYEPRTRDKALGHLARIVRNMPGELESMNVYFNDPLARPYLDAHWDEARLDDALWDAHAVDFIDRRTSGCAAEIAALIRDGDSAAKTTALLMTNRMWMPEDLAELRRNRRELPADSIYGYLLDFDPESFATLHASDPGLIAGLLHAEKALYRPPLKGIVGGLRYALALDDAERAALGTGGEAGRLVRSTFDAAKRARLLATLGAVWRYDKDCLEACDMARLAPYVQERRP
jgi:hypothetical protein